ncbi:MAG: F0F1 ATP synthase subunit B' [Alphaproteobacteria bacterium]|nr:MAG: F0F1 ATP synthase subunit B' [Alphaproteobacteria bacterium]
MATETHADAAGHGSVGLPQLDFATWDSQIFWLAVSLVVLFLLMSRIALPRIQTVIEDRADAIADDLDRAAEYKRKAEAAEKAYEAALAEARARAQKIAAEARAEVQRELAAAIARADAQIAERMAESERRIAEIRAGARESVRAVATEVAQAIVARLLPGVADDKAIARAVGARLDG